MSVRRERERRLAVGVIGLCVLIAVTGVFVFMAPGGRKEDALDNQAKALAAYNKIVSDLDAVSGSGRNLLETDPNRAGDLLNDAFKQLDTAAQLGYPANELAPLRLQVVDGLNRFYHVVRIKPQVIVPFDGDELSQAVLGPDGAAYVLDTTKSAVFRVDLVARAKAAILTKGQNVLGSIVSTPRLITVGGPDVVILDDHNTIWRWRPTAGDKTGKGTAIRIGVTGSSDWSGNIRAIGTYLTNADAGLYSLYVVDPGAQNIRRYRAAADGSSYSSGDTYLTVSQKVDDVNDMLIDGSLYVVQAGQIGRFDGGQAAHGWSVHPPDDLRLRTGVTKYTHIAASSLKQGTGTLYAFDSVNGRVLAFDKQDGSFNEQYMPGTGTKAFASMGGMFILPGPTTDMPTLYWTEGGNLMAAALNPAAPSVMPTPIPVCATPNPSAKPPASGPSPTPTPVCVQPTPKPSASPSASH